MATRSTSRKSANSTTKSRSGLKTAAVIAALGVATVAAAKGLKTRRGKALKKKAVAEGRKVLREAKGAARRGLTDLASRIDER